MDPYLHIRKNIFADSLILESHPDWLHKQDQALIVHEQDILSEVWNNVDYNSY